MSACVKMVSGFSYHCARGVTVSLYRNMFFLAILHVVCFVYIFLRHSIVNPPVTYSEGFDLLRGRESIEKKLK